MQNKWLEFEEYIQQNQNKKEVVVMRLEKIKLVLEASRNGEGTKSLLE